jgi:hypothetical protein
MLMLLLLDHRFRLFDCRLDFRDELVDDLLLGGFVDIGDFLFGDLDFVFLEAALALALRGVAAEIGGSVGVAEVGARVGGGLDDGGLLFRGVRVADVG